MLVIGKIWDWSGLIDPLISPNVKWLSRPLAWSYSSSSDDNPVPMVEYKDWGDANQDWHGEGEVGGPPLRLLTSLPSPTDFRPAELPLIPIVTPEFKTDVRTIAMSGFLG